MGNDNNRTSGAGGGCDVGGSVTPLECDVGLGLNSEPSYPCKKMSLININQYRHHDFGGVYGNNGSQQFFHHTNPTNQLAPRVSFKSITDGVMGVSGKVLFTATQWQELERQTIIYKYIMASIPIPPQLLLPSSTQSNRTSTGIRFSNGSDPEPWRCRRTDGKKWRCAKDVGPNQKYCERHAHKTRSRSRKPVDTNHNPTATSSNQQTRCHEWFIKSGHDIPISQSKRDDCSLSLSMQSGGNGNVNGMAFGDQESFQMAVRMLEGEGGGCGDGFRSHHQWLSQAAWVGSNPDSNPNPNPGLTPGGPLGEALCLGMSGMDHMDPNVASSYGSYEGGDGRGWFH